MDAYRDERGIDTIQLAIRRACDEESGVGDLTGMMLGIFMWRMKELLPMLDYHLRTCEPTEKDLAKYAQALPDSSKQFALELWTIKTLVLQISYHPQLPPSSKIPNVHILIPLSASAIIQDLAEMGITETITRVATAVLGYINRHGYELFRGMISTTDFTTGKVQGITDGGRIVGFKDGKQILEPVDMTEIHAEFLRDEQRQAESN